MLIIVFGLPGTGKTFFAEALAKSLQCKHFNTDVIRKKLLEKIDYSLKGRMKIYDVMLELSEVAMNNKKDIILDGTFLKKEGRAKFERKASKHSQQVFYIEMKAEEEEIKKRVAKKRANTDADFEVYLQLKKEFEPMTKKHLVLWSDQMKVIEMVSEAKKYLNKL